MVGTLPLLLKGLGYDVRVVLPYYRAIKQSRVACEPCMEGLQVDLAGEDLLADVFETRIVEGVPCYLIKRDEFFDRTNLYGTSTGDYYDNDLRFIYFCKAVFPLCRFLSFYPHVFHCHDWQASLIPAYLEFEYGQRSEFRNSRSLLTIHNLAYQGVFPPVSFDRTGLPGSFFTPEGIEFWGNANFLKAGINTANIINTVSPTYRREILTPEYGYGLEGVLDTRKNQLYGILNGVDYTEWDPVRDTCLAANYDKDRMEGKQDCKLALIKEAALSEGADHAPLFGMISRLTSQKGIDLVMAASNEMMNMGVHFILLGEGEERYRVDCESLKKKFPGRVSVRFGYDTTLAHRIQAGCDFLLMPSRYEPCGLNQIHAMKYGTVPVVRATGGLKDTVQAFNPKTGEGTGLLFLDYDPSALMKAVKEAVDLYAQGGQNWKRIRRACMEQCYSWDRSAEAYAKIYQELGFRS